MDEESTFRKAARRVLFDKPDEVQPIPGAGKSAADTPERHVRVKVTMNLDGDIISYFKEWGGRQGRAYQSLINQVLREHIEGTRPEQMALKVREMLLSDKDFLDEIIKRIGKLKG